MSERGEAVHVLLIKGSSQYGAMRLFIDCAAAAFQAEGHDVEVLDLEGVDSRKTLEAHAPGRQVDLVFTIAILGEFADSQGRSLAQLYRAPHVVWHVDYALGQSARLQATPPSTSLLFIDPTQIDAVRAVFGPDHFSRLGFFPHPAVGAPAPDDATAADFEANRPIQLLWSGSFQKAADWGSVPASLQRPLRDALDLALSVEWMPPHQAVTEVLAGRGIDTADPGNRGVVRLAAFVDDAVRKARRTDFMKAVAKTGLPVHICGVGWEPQLYRFKNAVHHGAIPMERLVELMRQARVVLNTNVNFGAGSHERPFSAALAGAVPFSDHSRYYDEAFAPGEIVLYRWRDLNGAMQSLKDLVGDPGRAHAIAQAAKARVVAEHTWARRLGLILQAAGLDPKATAA